MTIISTYSLDVVTGYGQLDCILTYWCLIQPCCLQTFVLVFWANLYNLSQGGQKVCPSHSFPRPPRVLRGRSKLRKLMILVGYLDKDKCYCVGQNKIFVSTAWKWLELDTYMVMTCWHVWGGGWRVSPFFEVESECYEEWFKTWNGPLYQIKSEAESMS